MTELQDVHAQRDNANPWFGEHQYDARGVTEARNFVRGFLRRNDNTGKTLRFMWNPSTIEYSLSIDTYAAAGQTMNPAAGTIPLPGTFTFGFSVYFDRQSDFVSGRTPNGTLADILTFYEICMDANSPAYAAIAADSNTELGQWSFSSQQIRVVFSKDLVFRGLVTAATVTHIKFMPAGGNGIVPVSSTLGLSLMVFGGQAVNADVPQTSWAGEAARNNTDPSGVTAPKNPAPAFKDQQQLPPPMTPAERYSTAKANQLLR